MIIRFSGLPKRNIASKPHIPPPITLYPRNQGHVFDVNYLCRQNLSSLISTMIAPDEGKARGYLPGLPGVLRVKARPASQPGICWKWSAYN